MHLLAGYVGFPSIDWSGSLRTSRWRRTWMKACFSSASAASDFLNATSKAFSGHEGDLSPAITKSIFSRATRRLPAFTARCVSRFVTAPGGPGQRKFWTSLSSLRTDSY
jgi:hypothetical protein